MAEVLRAHFDTWLPPGEADRRDWAWAAEVILAHLAATGSPESSEPAPAVIDAAHLVRQRNFSLATFGPGSRTAGVIDHIRRELREIEADPADLSEWIDVVILALDGAWRAGWEPQQIIDALLAKQTHNETRNWPDWRTAPPDQAIEHVREAKVPHG